VCTALPSGSKIAATSSGTSSGIGHDIVLAAGSPGTPPNAPATVDADAQRVAAQVPPARPAVAALAADDVALARHALPDACSSFTAAPKSATVPTNSWPVTIGTGTVFCAHSSQL
jgi:hypothetical protein